MDGYRASCLGLRAKAFGVEGLGKKSSDFSEGILLLGGHCVTEFRIPFGGEKTHLHFVLHLNPEP